MSDPVIVKSNKYGLTLQLDSSIDFKELIIAICEKFATNREFFGACDMILETTGREVSSDEAISIIQAIEYNSDIKIKLIHENNELKDARMKGQVDQFYTDEIFENAKIIRGSIIKEEQITSDSSVIVLGDVKSKASITARGNVIVFGSLEGAAYAGYPSNTGCYIACGSLNSDKLQIGTVKGEAVVQEKWSIRTRKSKNEAIGITVWHGELLAEPLSSGLLKKVK